MQRRWQRVSALNFTAINNDKLYLFDPEQIKTLRFDASELQKRDILISGYLREETEDNIFFPLVVVHLILVRLPKFKMSDEVSMVLAGALSVGKTALANHLTRPRIKFKASSSILTRTTRSAGYEKTLCDFNTVRP